MVVGLEERSMVGIALIKEINLFRTFQGAAADYLAVNVHWVAAPVSPTCLYRHCQERRESLVNKAVLLLLQVILLWTSKISQRINTDPGATPKVIVAALQTGSC